MRLNKRKLYFLLIVALVFLAAAFTFEISSSDKVAFFSDIYIPEDVTVNGTAFALFGDIEVDGTVRGEAVAVFGNISINGTVNGSTVAVMGVLEIGEHGVINGDAVGVGGGVNIAKGAVVRGEIADASIGLYKDNFVPAAVLVLGIFVLFGYALSWLAMLIMPDRIQYMTTESFKSVIRRFFVGLLTFFMFPIIIIALAITIIGIIAIPFFILIYLLIGFVSLIPMAISIGKLIVPSLQGKSAQYIHLFVGLVIVYILLLIPLISVFAYTLLVPSAVVIAIIGFLCFLILSAVAMGVVIDTRLGSSGLKGRG